MAPMHHAFGFDPSDRSGAGSAVVASWVQLADSLPPARSSPRPVSAEARTTRPGSGRPISSPPPLYQRATPVRPRSWGPGIGAIDLGRSERLVIAIGSRFDRRQPIGFQTGDLPFETIDNLVGIVLAPRLGLAKGPQIFRAITPPHRVNWDRSTALARSLNFSQVLAPTPSWVVSNRTMPATHRAADCLAPVAMVVVA